MSWFLPDDVRLRLQLSGDYKTIVISDAPAFYFRLNEPLASPTVADSSGNGRTGTVFGGVTFQQATLQPDCDKAALFNGTTGYISMPHAAAITPTGDFTVECWIKCSASAADVPIVEKFGGGAHPFDGFLFALNGDAASPGKVNLWTGQSWVHSATRVDDGQWHHVVAVLVGANVKFYIDGLLDATTTPTTPTLGDTHALEVGRRYDSLGFAAATLDDVALYLYALTPARVLAHYQAGVWTDVSNDLTDEDIVLEYGIPSSRPEDRCAPAGWLTFGLRNGTNNSGATVGYYSPYSAAKRSGFGFGIRAQLGITLGGVTNYWLGRLRQIVPQSDPFDEPVTHCAVLDWMDEAASQNAQVTLQQNARGDQAFTALVAVVPMAPIRTSIDVGSDTYAYAFDNIWNQAKVMAAFADLARSEVGYIGQKRDTVAGQTVFYESRHYRPTVTTLRATLNKSMTALDILGNANDILNHVRVTVHPRRADTGGTTVIARQDAAALSTILPGQSQTFFLNFTDPVQRDTFIGAKNVVTPLVATTDYTMNSASDGSGVDLTASFTVVVTVFASAIKVVITNASTLAGFVTKLQARGDGVYALNPLIAEAMNAGSIAASGDNMVDLDLLYQSDPTFAYNFAQYVTRLYGTPLANVRGVRFCANQSSTLLSAAVFGEISEKVALIDTVNGLTAAQPFYINAVKLSISQRNRIDCTWRLAPADTFRYWVLGLAGASELGSTAVLAL